MAVKWYEYEAEVRFVDRIVGGIPVIPEGTDRADAYEKWARGQEVENDPTFEKPLGQALAAEDDMPVTADQIEGLETGFRADDLGLYIEARQVKAMLRESAQRLGLIKKVRGTRQVLQHDLLVRAQDGSQKLHLGVEEPTGKDSRPISVVTRQGPRTAIKTFSYVTEPVLTFRIKVLAGGVGDGIIDLDTLQDMLDFGGDLGLGADRSQGEGTFELVSLKQIA
jgi:hypothetical protein